MLLGPVVAPIVGGVLAESCGWRSTFVFLAMLNLPILLLLVYAVPETHPWWVLQSLEEKNAMKTNVVNEDAVMVNAAAAEPQDDNITATIVAADISDTITATINDTAASSKGDMTMLTAYDRDTALQVHAHLSQKNPNRPQMNLITLSPPQPPVFFSPLTTLTYLFDLALAPYYLAYFLGFAIIILLH